MKGLAEGLSRLLAMRGLPVGGRLSVSLDADQEVRGLDEWIERLRESRSIGDSRQPQSIDVDVLWSRWQSTRPDLRSFSKREIRALCWDRRAANDHEFVLAIGGHEQYANSTGLLRGLWHAHQQHWRLATADRVEKMLWAQSKKRGTHPRWLSALLATREILDERAPNALMTRVGRAWRNAPEVLHSYGVREEGQLGSIALRQIRGAWLADVEANRSSPSVAQILQEGVGGVLRPDSTSPEVFRGAVELLMSLTSGSSKAYRDAIAAWILSEPRLGHPLRVKTRGHWVGISEKAKRLAVQLFAARDLKIFFDVLIGAEHDPQRRRMFWEPYAHSEQLTDFAIASDYHDKRRILATLGGSHADVASLESAPSDYSAFIMQFEGHHRITVVEISKPNNAMYLFSTADFEARVGSIQRLRFSLHALKDQGVGRHVHGVDWRGKFSLLLARYGVYAGISG